MRVVKYAQTVRIQFCDFLQREGKAFRRNKEVQRLVNREQDEEFIFALLRHAREIGFTSTNTLILRCAANSVGRCA
jgi:hypothetical protein